jgi:hypothetical protein
MMSEGTTPDTPDIGACHDPFSIYYRNSLHRLRFRFILSFQFLIASAISGMIFCYVGKYDDHGYSNGYTATEPTKKYNYLVETHWDLVNQIQCSAE